MTEAAFEIPVAADKSSTEPKTQKSQKPARSAACPYSPSCFTCPLPDCRMSLSACVRVNNLN